MTSSIGSVPLDLSGDTQRGAAAREVAKALEMVMQEQEQTYWCWAAVGTSVGLFFRTGSWTQCGTATGCLTGSDCCKDPAPCNHYGYLDDALRYTKSLRSFDEGTKSAAQIREQIDLGRPIGALIDWQAGGSHFIAITGYSHPESDPSELTLTIEDSIYGTSTLLLADFPEHYQVGGKDWTYSYLTQPSS